MRINRPSPALYELLEEIGHSAGLKQALAALDGGLRRVVPFDAMAVYLVAQERLFPAYRSDPDTKVLSGSGIPVGYGITGRVAETRRPAFNRDPGAEAGGDGRFHSMLAVPLDDGADLAGVLALYSAALGSFEPADLGVLLWVRADLTRAIRRALRFDRPSPDLFDAITGLLNERGMFPQLDADLACCRRAGKALALLLCGVDGLAGVQARFGEHARAHLVRSVAAGFSRTCREEDWVARFGDDFVVMLKASPETDAESAPASLTALVEGASMAHFGEHLLSLRVGAGHFPGDALDAEGLLAAAGARQCPVPPVPHWLSAELRRLSIVIGAGNQPADFEERPRLSAGGLR